MAYYSEVRVKGKTSYKRPLLSKEDKRFKFYEYELLRTYSLERQTY